MIHLLYDFLSAVSFLTIVPIPSRILSKTRSLVSSMVFYPFIGFLIAALSLGLVAGLKPFLSERLESLLLVLFPILLSGGLHVDGLADFFDGFFQGRNREGILAVMKDSRIGVWGTLSVVFLVLLKWEFLMIVPVREMSFLTALTFSRWSFVVLSYLFPYARPEGGLGQAFAGKVGFRELAVASASCLAMNCILGSLGIGLFIGSALFVFCAGKFYQKKIGGITGDLMGATGEMLEVFIYFLIVLLSVWIK